MGGGIPPISKLRSSVQEERQRKVNVDRMERSRRYMCDMAVR